LFNVGGWLYNGIINKTKGKSMLDIAFGMKQVANEACDNPMIAFMAQGLDAMRTEVDSDEFLSALAGFAMSISAMAVSGTVCLTLSEDAQAELVKTIEELESIANDIE
jgi:hypothetical protein